MLFDCTMLPMPKPARPPNSANVAPSQAQRGPRPLRMAYIGPPTKRPFASRSRKCTASSTSAYLVAMPTSAVIHIQNTAPGPPSATAVATPAMLPTPMVAARHVISAAYGLTSPWASSPPRPLHTSRRPAPILRTGMPPSRTCRYKPVPRISTSMAGPQTNESRALIQSVNVVMNSPVREIAGRSVPSWRAARYLSSPSCDSAPRRRPARVRRRR